MTAKELKKLSRKDLLEILLEQSKQMMALEQQLAQAREELESRKIQLNESGSIAEAALKLNGVFEAAQAASQQYVDNIKSLSERQEQVCQQREQECTRHIEQRMKEAEQTREQMLLKTKKQCLEILEQVKAKAAQVK